MKYALRLATVVKQVTIGAALAVVFTPYAAAEPRDSLSDVSARPVGRWVDSGASDSATVALPAGGWSLALAFEENLGQADGSVRYLARGAGYGLYLTDREAVLALSRAGGRNDTLTMRLAGANRAPRISGEERLPGVSNYFVGNDPTKWRTGVAHYGEVRYERVYPGVDLVFYGRDGQLEYDFVVAPGADPGAIQLEYVGASSIRIDGNGDLVLVLDNGEVRHRAPLVYQNDDGNRRTVSGRFVLGEGDRVGFEVGDYDRTASLVVDPVLSYATYFGGSAWEYLEDMALHTDGSVFLVGTTGSIDLPAAGSPPQAGLNGSYDAWVARLSASGTELIYSTYLGGSEGDNAFAVALDADGNAYVTGETSSADFPVAGSPFQGTLGGDYDAFVVKLSPTGSTLVYSTFVGGLDSDGGRAIAVASGGEAVVAGHTYSDDFPIAGSPFHSTRHGEYDGFVTRLNASGSALVFSTYLGGSENESIHDLVLGADGSVDVVGATSSPDFPTAGSPVKGAYGGEGDAYVLRLSAGGGALLYSTYLGGTANDCAYAVELDPTGRLLVAGETESGDFPTVGTPIQSELRGENDGFVAKLDLTAGSLVYSTYLGGSGFDWVSGMAIDAAGNVHITGPTTSNDFPIAGTPVQGAYGGGSHDAFLSTIDPAGSALTFSTFLGGGDYDGGVDVAVDGSGNLVLAGGTKSTDFPLVGTPFQGAIAGSIDAFVARIATSSGAEPVAGFTWSPIAPDVGQAVQFTDTSTGDPTSWSWAFGDGQTDTTQNPVHEYSSAGAKTVTLTVSNQYGSGSRSQTIGVGCDPIAGAPALTVSAVGSGIVRLTWTAVEGATGYRLYRSAWPASSVPIAEGEGRTYTDSHVEPQTYYCYYVETYNLCGNGPVSDSECVTTPVALPEEAWVPVASRAGGAAGSTWRTDLALVNPWDYASGYELRFRRDGEIAIAGGSLAAGCQEILTDVVDQLGDSGSGTLEVRSLRPLKVSSRTYNQSSSGTFGQNLPGYRVAEGLAAGQSAYLPQLTENAAFRSNILLSNMSKQQAVAVVELHDGAGAVLAEYTVTLEPGQWRQENRPFFTKAGEDDLAAGYARVSVTAGSGVVALASVVDNLTNDPTTQAMVVAPQGTAWRWVPVASHAAGAHGSEWRTDLGVLNTGGQAASFKLRFLTGGEEWNSSETVAVGDQLILVDVVGLLGAAGSGALAVEVGPGVIVSSRTYNQSPSGTFGQNLPGYETGDGLGDGSSAYLPQLTENASYRTNILLTNTGAAPAVANVYLYDGAGTELASYVAELEPGEQSQKNRPFFSLAGQSDLASGYATVHVTVGSGVVACASVVDNMTNDPTTILMAK